MPWLMALMGLALMAGLYVKRDQMVASFERITPVRFVRIEGAFDGVDPKQIETALTPMLGSSFLTLDLPALEAASKRVPWVKSARVSTLWPDTLVVVLEELQPYARWGRDRLIAATGEVFARPDAHVGFESLILLDGPLGHEQEVIEMQRQLEQRFAGVNEHVATLVLSNRLSWTATLGNGLEIRYGSQNPLVATDQLLSVLPKLAHARDAVMVSIDLRYPRGLAITWKPLVPADGRGTEGKLQAEPKNG